MGKEKYFWVGVKALIEDEKGKILLFKAPGWPAQNLEPHWDIPGGRIDVGEEPLTALKRELLEETGISDYSEPDFFTAVIANPQTKLDIGTVGLAIFVYKVKIADDVQVKISDEHTEYEWVARPEAAQKLEYKYPPALTKILLS
jgi:8-oxo-dGTP pyrophosphatase MutT (NUDIX family)